MQVSEAEENDFTLKRRNPGPILSAFLTHTHVHCARTHMHSSTTHALIYVHRYLYLRRRYVRNAVHSIFCTFFLVKKKKRKKEFHSLESQRFSSILISNCLFRRWRSCVRGGGGGGGGRSYAWLKVFSSVFFFLLNSDLLPQPHLTFSTNK